MLAALCCRVTRPGNPANAKQVLFFLDELGDEEAGAAMR